ncbi:MAG: DUF192 domain-containing protein [Ignavibacteriales bacterium]|nr:MAG: DUF192 domain-containing protein [Ignavibacteriales bacterium]
MAQKNQKKTESSYQKGTKKKLPLSRVVAIGLLVIAAGFFVINNFMNNNKHEVTYYTFTKEGELVFTDSLGNTKTKIEMEYAADEYETQLGLMNRKEMKENQGMLFIFPDESPRSFWMRNTLISLDMLFVNSNKEIVTIHKSTKVLSDQSYPSSKPAKYVVEVVGGFCDKYGIKEGDKISWMGTRMGL